VELNQGDLKYFVRFVLLDEATRNSSGKRQLAPLKGFWLCYGGKHRMRGAHGDIPRRRYVCIEAFRTLGRKSVEKAAARVAKVIGQGTSEEVNRIRVAYYPCRYDKPSWNLFVSQFLDWRKWVFEADEETLVFAMQLYGKEFGETRRRRLTKLIETIKRDSAQQTRNRECLLEAGQAARDRIESNYWEPSQWQFRATDLWSLGRLHAGIGERMQARYLFERALVIWKTYGHELAHVQIDAIRDLEAEIARLGSVSDAVHSASLKVHD
jgi:hypothetical protein